MAEKKDDIKRILKTAAFAARKYPTEKQLTEAAEELVKKGWITEEDVLVVGEKVASDRQIFATTDIEDINNVLDKGRGK
jgi:hypothetical protein